MGIILEKFDKSGKQMSPSLPDKYEDNVTASRSVSLAWHWRFASKEKEIVVASNITQVQFVKLDLKGALVSSVILSKCCVIKQLDLYPLKFLGKKVMTFLPQRCLFTKLN